MCSCQGTRSSLRFYGDHKADNMSLVHLHRGSSLVGGGSAFNSYHISTYALPKNSHFQVDIGKIFYSHASFQLQFQKFHYNGQPLNVASHKINYFTHHYNNSVHVAVEKGKQFLLLYRYS